MNERQPRAMDMHAIMRKMQIVESDLGLGQERGALAHNRVSLCWALSARQNGMTAFQP
jgi:hypothetical protein